jgi:hypothetical protein
VFPENAIASNAVNVSSESQSGRERLDLILLRSSFIVSMTKKKLCLRLELKGLRLTNSDPSSGRSRNPRSRSTTLRLAHRRRRSCALVREAGMVCPAGVAFSRASRDSFVHNAGKRLRDAAGMFPGAR